MGGERKAKDTDAEDEVPLADTGADTGAEFEVEATRDADREPGAERAPSRGSDDAGLSEPWGRSGR